MVNAYCMISAAPGKTMEVLQKVKAIDEVKLADSVAGEYDIVTRIEVDSLEKLSKIVFGVIRVMPGVMATMTLIVF